MLTAGAGSDERAARGARMPRTSRPARLHPRLRRGGPRRRRDRGSPGRGAPANRVGQAGHPATSSRRRGRRRRRARTGASSTSSHGRRSSVARRRRWWTPAPTSCSERTATSSVRWSRSSGVPGPLFDGRLHLRPGPLRADARGRHRRADLPAATGCFSSSCIRPCSSTSRRRTCWTPRGTAASSCVGCARRREACIRRASLRA